MSLTTTKVFINSYFMSNPNKQILEENFLAGRSLKFRQISGYGCCYKRKKPTDQAAFLVFVDNKANIKSQLHVQF